MLFTFFSISLKSRDLKGPLGSVVSQRSGQTLKSRSRFFHRSVTVCLLPVKYAFSVSVSHYKNLTWQKCKFCVFGGIGLKMWRCTFGAKLRALPYVNPHLSSHRARLSVAQFYLGMWRRDLKESKKKNLLSHTNVICCPLVGARLLVWRQYEAWPFQWSAT